MIDLKNIKNTEFADGKKLLEMNLETAKEYKTLIHNDIRACYRCRDRRTATSLKRVRMNIKLYIDYLSNK